MINIFAIPSFLAGFINLFLAFYVFFKNPKEKVNIILSVTLFTLFIWGFSEGMERITLSEDVALFFVFLSGFSVILPALFLHFAVLITKRKVKKLGYFLIYFSGILAVFFRSFTGLFVNGVVRNYWGFSAILGEYYNILSIWFVSIFILIFYLFFKQFKKSKGLEKNKFKLLTIGISIPLVLGSITEVILPILKIEIIELAVLGTLFLGIFLSKAITEYGIVSIGNLKISNKLINVLPLGILILNKNMLINFSNNIMEKFLKRNVLNKNFYSFFEKETFEKIFEELAISETKQLFSVNIQRNKKTFFDISITKYGDKGVLKGYILLFKDVSTEKNQERMLEKKVKELTDMKTAIFNMLEDMEENNRDLENTKKKLSVAFRDIKKLDSKKDEFISVAAHELKTPITAIHGFSQLLSDEKIIKNKKLRNEYLGVIDRETGRLGRLITEVLDLSRIDLGTMNYIYSKTDMNTLIEDVKASIEPIAKKKKIKLIFNLQKNLPLISTDKEKLTRVILNLISNAIRYTEKGSVQINVEKQSNHIYLSVKDTGIGIPKEHFSKIFSRFYQVDQTYTRKVGGTGLGLSVSKQLILGLNGTIGFTSKKGKGSNFFFKIPLNNNLKE